MMIYIIFTALIIYAILHIHRTRGFTGLMQFVRENLVDMVIGISIAFIILFLLNHFGVV